MYRLLLLLRRRHTDDRREQLAQDPGCERAQRVDRNLRIGGGAAQPVIGGEETLRTATQERTDDRNIAEQRIQRISGRHGSLQLEPVLVEIDPALRGHPERLAKTQEALEG